MTAKKTAPPVMFTVLHTEIDSRDIEVKTVASLAELEAFLDDQLQEEIDYSGEEPEFAFDTINDRYMVFEGDLPKLIPSEAIHLAPRTIVVNVP